MVTIYQALPTTLILTNKAFTIQAIPQTQNQANTLTIFYIQLRKMFVQSQNTVIDGLLILLKKQTNEAMFNGGMMKILYPK